MNEINLDKYKNILNRKNNNDDKDKTKKYLKNLLSRLLIVSILFLSLMIVYKNNFSFKDKVNNIIYDKGISFSKINKVYNKYLKGILPLKKEDSLLAQKVFDEKLTYNSIDYYYDGVSLEVTNNYTIPNINEGMVTFIGEKELYGRCIIIENLDGVEILYGNISNTSLKLYDYIKEGEIVGEASKTLYLTFNKDGNYLAYENFIS